MTVTVVDAFNRADSATTLGNADSGETWVPRPQLDNDFAIGPTSVLGIAGSRAYSPNTNLDLATIDHGGPDVVVGLDFVTPFPPGNGCGPIARWQGPKDFWQAIVFRSNIGNGYSVTLRRWYVGGDYGDLASAVFADESLTGVHRVEFSALGNALSASIDAVAQVAGTSSAFNLSNHHGLSTYYSAAVRMDNYNAVANPRVGGWVVGDVAI